MSIQGLYTVPTLRAHWILDCFHGGLYTTCAQLSSRSAYPGFAVPAHGAPRVPDGLIRIRAHGADTPPNSHEVGQDAHGLVVRPGTPAMVERDHGKGIRQ